MKKKVLSILLVIIMVLSLAACGKKDEGAAPSEEKAPDQTAAAAAAEDTARTLSLTEVSFSVTTWSSPNGATVNLTAVPSDYAKGDSAQFVVRLNGTDLKVDGLTGKGMTWDENGMISKAPAAMVVKDGAYAPVA